MEPQASPPNSRRKVRFAPKAPARRKINTAPLKKELIEEDDGSKEPSEAQTLLRQFNDNLARRGRKSERKTQVVFGGGAKTTSIRSFGLPKAENASKKSNEGLKSSNDDQFPTPFPSKIVETSPLFEEVSDLLSPIPKRDKRETWDYEHSYYPTVLPRRRPYSEKPEIPDEDELRDAAKKPEHKPESTNPASELGLMEEDEKGKLLCFQFPLALPLVKRPASAKGKERVGSSASSSEPRNAPTMGCTLEELSAGYVGKLLVYKSGAIKLKLGNTLYEVSTGSDAKIPREVMAINTAKKQCCVLGEFSKQAIISSDLDQVDPVIDLG